MLTNFLGSSFLIIAVFVIRALFARHTSRRFIYALWLIVLVRLLMPMPVFDLDIEIPLPISHDVGTTKDRDTYYPPITAENPEIPQAPTTENTIPPQPVSPQPVEKNIDWAKVFNTVHIAGAGALALWFCYVNISLYTRLKKDRVKLETSHNLPVYKTNVLTTPCLFGVVKPAIYLTEAACDERHINNVITHEMCHYRHWDNLWNFLGMVCVVMWWWNPLVWLSFFTAKRDGELACDELALEILGENGRIDYGRTLIEMAQNRPHNRLSVAATVSGGAKEMKERIMAIANKRKNMLWAVTVVAVIAVLCTVIGFSGAERDENNVKVPAESQIESEVSEKEQKDNSANVNKPNSSDEKTTANINPTENNSSETTTTSPTENNSAENTTPADAYSYGIVTDVIEIDKAFNVTTTCYYIIDGNQGAYQANKALSVNTGVARFTMDNNSITRIENLEPFDITSIEGKKAVADGKKYDISGDVQVYLHRNNTYSVINLAEVANNDNYALSGYADGAVRVIIAEKLENMSGYTPVLIKSFDGETMVVDPVEYITTDDTERIALLELDPEFDLPSGYYIHNETEESISLKVSGAVFEFVDWNRQFTKPDGDLFYETSSAAEFLQYCGTYDGGIPANTPFFLNINGNKLLKLKEIILA